GVSTSQANTLPSTGPQQTPTLRPLGRRRRPALLCYSGSDTAPPALHYQGQFPCWIPSSFIGILLLECRPVRPLLAILLCALSCGTLADTIHLKNGRTIAADVVREKGERVEYDVGDDTYAIPK